MAMHRKNKSRRPKQAFDYNPETGKFDKPRPWIWAMPWFIANRVRQRIRRDIAKLSRRKNRYA